MSGILYREMLKLGMARSRNEVRRMIEARQIRLTHNAGMAMMADCDDLELPGKTFISTGKHMFRLAPRLSGAGFDQLRCWGEIPVTEPEGSDGCIHIASVELHAQISRR